MRYFAPLLTVILLSIVLSSPKPSDDRPHFDRTPQTASKTPIRDAEEDGGPEVQSAVYDEIFSPYDGTVPRSVLESIWDQIGRISPPDKRAEKKLEDPWELIGPLAIFIPAVGENQYYGRVMDFEIADPDEDIRIASNTGGLWQGGGVGDAVPLADNINTLVYGSFATNPLDPDVIFIGTGHPDNRVAKPAGLGLFRTDNGGGLWTPVPMDAMDPNNDPKSFFRVRYDRFDFDKIHACTTEGYWQSTNGGADWTKPAIGQYSDIAQHPFDPDILYMTRWAGPGQSVGGLYRSDDGGLNWTQMGGDLPTDNVGRGSVTVVGSAMPVIYVNFARADDHTMLGVFRSDNDGASWDDITPPPDPASFRNGWHNNTIAASPLNPDVVLLGWVDLWRSTTGGLGGAAWTKITQSQLPGPGPLHPDVMLLRFQGGGSWVGMATDGGLYVSEDAGLNWRTADWFPITQFYHLDVNPIDSAFVAGGSQDNGVSWTDFAGSSLSWGFGVGGDGGGIAIQMAPFSPIFATDGVTGGPLAYSNLISLDGGFNWSVIDNGVDPSNNWVRRMRTPRDNTDPNPVYTNAGPWVYEYGPNWTKLNPVAFEDENNQPVSVSDITVIGNDGLPMWVTTKGTALAADRVFYVDHLNNWTERSAGLPVGRVFKVAGNRYGTSTSVGYALMSGLEPSIVGARVWYTDDGGQNWRNITGNLPDVPVNDLLPSPINSNVLYLATSFGCFKTNDQNANPVVWTTWNQGWPPAVDVREFSPYFDFDSGRHYIYAATFGRSAWRRPLTSDIGTGVVSLPATVEIASIHPNPTNGPTTIRFRGIPGQRQELSIYDARGRLVRRVHTDSQAGWQEVVWDGRDEAGRAVASGVYHAVLRSGGVSTRSKVALVR